MGEETTYKDILQRGVSRRDFLKFCTVMAATLGLPSTFIPKIAKAIEKKPNPYAVWLEIQDCAGNQPSRLPDVQPTNGIRERAGVLWLGMAASPVLHPIIGMLPTHFTEGFQTVLASAFRETQIRPVSSLLEWQGLSGDSKYSLFPFKIQYLTNLFFAGY
jgi:hypothetical protein